MSTCPTRCGQEDRPSGPAPAKARRRRAPDARPRRRGEKTGVAHGRRATRCSYRSLSKPEFAFGVMVQRPPEHAIDDNDEQAHHGNAENDVVKITGFGLFRDV